VKAGFVLMGIGLLLISFSYIVYKRTEKKLNPLKKEDIVSYYLDLALHLLPLPLWSAVLGLLLFIIAIIVIIVKIPLVL